MNIPTIIVAIETILVCNERKYSYQSACESYSEGIKTLIGSCGNAEVGNLLMIVRSCVYEINSYEVKCTAYANGLNRVITHLKST